MVSSFFKASLLLATLLVLGLGCQKNDGLNSGLIGEALMSDRPAVEAGAKVFLIEFKGAPLANAVQKNAQGVNEVDADAKAEVEKEQAQAEAKLKELSSEIGVIYRYKYLINGMSIVAPIELQEKISKLPFVSRVQPRNIFPQPKVKLQLNPMKAAMINPENTSVTFIHAQAAYEAGIKGQGIRVGVLDTGLDYTHSMLGGSGKVEDYKSVDVNGKSEFFPNKKVVGGIDLVGTRFDTGSLDPARRIPVPDANPMDEGGHGTHVAGSIAGIGDGVNSYDGVAPEAELYAIKVFGSGSTGDEVVIAGLEWALDPNQDGKLDDQLQVVNLSLGGANGSPYELYNKAVTNLTRMGTMMVASAGNESDIPFIVGSPSTSDEALSVAAQTDGSDHNWKFRTIEFLASEKRVALAEALEASISKPIKDVEEAKAAVVFGGLADKDYTPEEAAEIKGKVLLVDRGVVTFQEKMARGEKAGAIGVIVAQNRPEAPFTMGGDGHVEIPAVMISQELGAQIKAEMEKGTVVANFKSPEIIEKPELIGVMTDFSSRGPRTYDLLIKPEITAPGNNIISASMGEGTKAVQMSGTSMSGPHVAGVMALMKQKYSTLSTRELKSVVMSTATPIVNTKKETESIARQGAGQVNIARALGARLVTEPAALSLGFQQIEKEKRITQSLRLKSLGDDDLEIQVSLESSSSAVSMPAQTVSLKPRGLTDVKLNMLLRASVLAGLEDEVSGWVVLKSGEQVQKVPFLVRLQKISNVKLTKSEMGSSSQRDAEGSTTSFEFTNKGQHAGDIWAFNLLGNDDRKTASDSPMFSSECDIKAVGYRIRGDKLEVGVKFFKRVTSWAICEISVMLDKDGDKKPEAELALTPAGRIPGLSGDQVISTLLDFPKAQKLREEAEKKAKESQAKIPLVLADAVLSQDEAVAADLRSSVIIQISLADLRAVVGMSPRIQVLSTANEGKNVEMDDYLKDSKHWETLSLSAQDQSWVGLSNITLQAGQTQKVEIIRGAARNSLLLMYPNNSLDTRGLSDEQVQVFKPRYTIKP